MLDKAKFKHKIHIPVRNYEIDWQGIVHNANYLLYCEVGRVAYLEEIGIKVDINSIQHESKVVVARNEIDYLSPARFGEIISVHTRISYIRNSSFAFEGILEESRSNRRIAENISIHVWLDHRTDEPTTVTDEFRRSVQRFEGDHVLITWPTFLT
jgi:acyl-CoA thioester hydrolase